MKKLFILLSLIILSVSIAAAQKKLIVNDYFLSIPTEYLKIDRVQRVKWIQEDDAKNGYLAFNVPLEGDAEEDWGGAEVWGEVQLFSAKNGNTIVGMIVNRCLESVCEGQLLLLEYDDGNWENVSDELVPTIDTDEIVKILKDAPAYERPIIKDEEIPLTLGFQREEKAIQYYAACTSPGCDGAVVAKLFKWNGETFKNFQYQESP